MPPVWLPIASNIAALLAVPVAITAAHFKNRRDFKRMGLSKKDLTALYRYYFLGKGRPPRPTHGFMK